VQIDLYRGNGSSLAEARYIGSLLIENIPAAAQGEPEIDLLIGIDESGQFFAEASDMSTGEAQKFATSLSTLAAEDTYREPEFEMDLEKTEEVELEERPLTGESYPVSEEDRRRERIQKKGPNIFLLVLFVLLGVLLVVAIAYFIYRSIQGPQIPPLSVSGSATTATQPAQPSAAQSTSSQTATAPAASTQSTAAAPAATQATAAPAASGGTSSTGAVTYRIKQGDTLWDISSTYYRNPWLYPKLANANSIRNPDLIFAGTRITIPEN
jgi:LysM repeat protein